MSACVSVLGVAKGVSTPPAQIVQLTVTGAVTVTAAGLPPITVPIAPTIALPNKTVKVYACTGAA